MRNIAFWLAAALLLPSTMSLDACAQVNDRAKLIAAQRELQRYLLDEAEYNRQTLRHREGAIDHLLNTLAGTGVELVFGKKLKEAYKTLATSSRYADAMRSGDYDQAAEELATYPLEELLDRTLDEATRKLPGKSALRQLNLLGRIPDFIDLAFDLTALHEDEQQRKSLDLQREKAIETINYWTRRISGQQVSEPPSRQQTMDRDFIAQMQRLGVHVATADGAMRDRLAQIAARARSGFSRTDVVIANKTNDMLMLDFSGVYLIPAGATSNSQRLGLVSAIESDVSGNNSHTRIFETGSFSEGITTTTFSLTKCSWAATTTSLVQEPLGSTIP